MHRQKAFLFLSLFFSCYMLANEEQPMDSLDSAMARNGGRGGGHPVGHPGYRPGGGAYHPRHPGGEGYPRREPGRRYPEGRGEYGRFGPRYEGEDFIYEGEGDYYSDDEDFNNGEENNEYEQNTQYPYPPQPPENVNINLDPNAQ